MLAKLLEEMEKSVIITGGCGDLKRILNACGETLYCAEYSDCDECKKDSLKVIAKLKEQVSEQSKESGWIPVEERLPENEVLCCDECGHMLVGYIFKDEYSNTGYNAESDNESIQNVVAWMPLPTPYKKEK